MVLDLGGITVEKFLEKFGLGNHIPGSGSAVAFEGMLCSKLLITVIDLTTNTKHKANYKLNIDDLNNIKNKIEAFIYPELEQLFQDDSEQFDKVIKYRRLRDEEENWDKKKAFSLKEKEELKLATKIPIRIAELCLELVHFSNHVFVKAFRPARGDSAAALNAALAAVISSLSIVELNFSSLPVDYDIKELREKVSKIKIDYDKVSNTGREKLDILEKEALSVHKFLRSIAKFKDGNLSETVRTNTDIENIARELQNIIWINKDKIWKKEVPENPFQILKPDVVLKKIMDYEFSKSDNIGFYKQDGQSFKVAGIIDKRKKHVVISTTFSNEIQNFTVAHELGHALLHKNILLHRDRSIDDFSNLPRNKQELQADKFATYFLMPTRLVEELFYGIFEMEYFEFNENNALKLGFHSVSELRKSFFDIRSLSRFVASLERFGIKPFNSLARIFNVSVETMAIRLEELNLIKF